MKSIIFFVSIISCLCLSPASYAVDIKKAFEKQKIETPEKKKQTKPVATKKKTKTPIKKKDEKNINTDPVSATQPNISEEKTLNSESISNEPIIQPVPQRKCLKLWGKDCFFGE